MTEYGGRMTENLLPPPSFKHVFPTFLSLLVTCWLAFMVNLFGGVKLFTGHKLYEGQIVRIEPLGNISGVVTGRRDFGAGDAYYVRYDLLGKTYQDSFQRWHLIPNPLERR
jgi:hypothetical protein